MKFPASANELVDELDRLFPEVVPSADDTMIEIQRQSAKREMVQFLKHWRDQRVRSANRKVR
jgi:hypothetical protein